MKNSADPFIQAYIAARRTERTIDLTNAIARQWRVCVSAASDEGDDLFAVEALQNAQRYHKSIIGLSQQLAAQEADLTRLHSIYADSE